MLYEVITIGKVYIHSPEDLILYKLIYFGLSQQSKHSRDIAAILKSKKSELDLEYIERWVTRLGLTSLWNEMLDNVSWNPVIYGPRVGHISRSGMIGVLGNQFSTQKWIVFGSSESLRLPEKCVLTVITSYSIHYTKLYEDDCFWCQAHIPHGGRSKKRV